MKRAADAPALEAKTIDDSTSKKNGFDSSKGHSPQTPIQHKRSSVKTAATRDPEKKKKEEGFRSSNGLLLSEALPSEREELLSQRFKICSIVYDFRQDTMAREKETKRQALIELVDYVSNARNGFNEAAMQEAMDMVAINLFRALESREPSPLALMDMDDEDFAQDIAWPHLQLVYEFLLRFVSSKDTDVKVAQNFLNLNFIEGLLGLLDSDDDRERDFVKNIMNKYYNRFTAMRPVVRKALQHACLRAAYENEMSTGIAELLELMVKVINGFTVPLKSESKQLLTSVLIPLHKAQMLFNFQAQLTRCLMMYVEKDAKLCHVIIAALLSAWPCTNGSKQVLFLEEIEDLLKHLPPADFPRILPGFVNRLTVCITCDNSNVAERALQLWNVSSFTKLINGNRKATFPPIISALYRNATQHWNGTVHGRTFDVLRLLMEADENLFSESSARHRRNSEEQETREVIRLRRWAVLQDLFDKKEKERQAIAARKAKQEKANAPKAVAKATSVTSAHQVRQDVRCLTGINYGFCISDVFSCDLQVLIIDNKGETISVVSADNYTDLNAAIVHSGSLQARRYRSNSAYNGCADEIWVALPRLPLSVRQLFFVLLPCHRKVVHSKSPCVCTARLIDGAARKSTIDFSVDLNTSQINVLAAFERNPDGSWNFARISLPLPAKPSETGTKTRMYFVDALEAISGLVRDKIPSAVRPLRVCLQLEKGSVIDLAPHLVPNSFFVCTGWDLKGDGYLNEEIVTVDVSAVLFGINGKELGVVCADIPDELGVRHSGSGLLSASVSMSLETVAEQVSQIFLVAHVSSSNATCDLIQHPTCRIIDHRGACIMSFGVGEHSQKRGLIFGRLHVEQETRRWRFQAMGNFCDGKHCRDPLTSLELQALFQKSLPQFQRRPDHLQASTSTTANGRLFESL